MRELADQLRRYAVGPHCAAFQNESGAMADAMSQAASALESLFERNGRMEAALRQTADDLRIYDEHTGRGYQVLSTETIDLLKSMGML